MNAIAKLADQVAIARESGTFVVLTPDEAQAIIDEAVVRKNRTTDHPQPEAWIAYPASGKALTFYPERAAAWRKLGDHVVALYPGPDEAHAVGGCPVCGDDACPGNHAAGSVVMPAGGPPYEADDEHA